MEYLQNMGVTASMSILIIRNKQLWGLIACHADLLTQFDVKANLVVQILESDNLWGLLIAHQCCEPRKCLVTSLKGINIKLLFD